MICANPYIRGGIAYGCGQCLPCSINRKRTWTHRLILERTQHSDAAFVTLTYRSTELPVVDTPDGTGSSATLVPEHVRNWLKRLRFAIAPTRIRFFLVGEYGDTTQRPHYHAILFGYPSCQRGRTRHIKGDNVFDCCPHCNLLWETWTHGGIDVGDVTDESIQYCCGYVTKKMTERGHPNLNGRHPEFARMSNRPGIGKMAMHDVASALLSLNLENAQPDVPSALRHGNRLLPLGRYLRRYLRTLVGKDEKISQEAFDEVQKKMSSLYTDLVYDSINSKGEKSVKQGFVDHNKGKIRNMTARQKLFKKRNAL